MAVFTHGGRRQTQAENARGYWISYYQPLDLFLLGGHGISCRQYQCVLGSDADTGELVQSLVVGAEETDRKACPLFNWTAHAPNDGVPPCLSPKSSVCVFTCLTVIALRAGQVPGLGAEGSPQHPGRLGGPALPQASPWSCVGAVATVTGPALLHLIFIKGGLCCGLV